jgi:hypothetical protein
MAPQRWESASDLAAADTITTTGTVTAAAADGVVAAAGPARGPEAALMQVGVAAVRTEAVAWAVAAVTAVDEKVPG